MRGEFWHYWAPISALLLFSAYTTTRLVRAHIKPEDEAPNYTINRDLVAPRGTIYSSSKVKYPFVSSVPYWEYRLDPLVLTNAVAIGAIRRKHEPPRTKAAVIKSIADALGLSYSAVTKMVDAPAKRGGWRSQFLSMSSDPVAHATLADSSLVQGISIQERQVRQYLHGRSLSHVLGSVNAEHVGSAGLEQKYNTLLTGTPGRIQGLRDARGHEIYDKRKISVEPVPGADIYLTIDQNIQFEAEDALKWGLAEYGAAYGWCIVMDASTGAIYAMASLPDFHPQNFGSASDAAKLNRACAFTYEPGSVMKVITVASAIDANFISPGTVYNTRRDDNRYYKLPGDAGHVWDPTMTVKDAVVHSSNIVIGKLGCDFGPVRLYSYMRKFGFGERTGIELPGEEVGILYNPAKHRWDKATWSRAAIGQAFTVTAIQLISAYQALANDGLRMQPHLVDHIVNADGTEAYRYTPKPLGRPVSAKTARTMREVMLDVASPKGTARRAAIRGYSVAGKTGTAQKSAGKRGYLPGLFRATFCGIVPARAPRLVVLVTLDFNEKTKYHQGGNSAGPVFKRITTAALRYLQIPPDKPDELLEYDDEDEFERIMEARARKYGAAEED